MNVYLNIIFNYDMIYVLQAKEKNIMEKLAKDIIFIKDNMGNLDKDTWNMIQQKSDLRKKKQEKQNEKILPLNMLLLIWLSPPVIMLLFAGNILQYMTIVEVFILFLGLPCIWPFILSVPILVSNIKNNLSNFKIYYMVISVITLIMLFMTRNSTILVFLICTFIAGIIINIIYFSSLSSEKRKEKNLNEAISAIQLDETTIKVYDMLESYRFKDLSYRTWGDATIAGYYPLPIRCTIHFADILKNKYPVAQMIAMPEIDVDDLFAKILNSKGGQQIIRQNTNEEWEKYTKLLYMENDVIKITNHDKEIYVKTIKKLIESLPRPSFDVEMVAKIGEDVVLRDHTHYDSYTEKWYYDQIALPTLSESASGVLQSRDFQILENQNRIYKERLKEFQADLKGTLIGEQGEREVHKELEFFSDQMKILDNVRLEVNGQSIESDIVCIAPQGVFVLEVKNLGSTGTYNINIDKDGRWQKVMKNGRYKPMGSVSRQNNRHLHGIEQVVNKALGNKLDNWIQAKSIVVFANDVVGIRNYSQNICVVRASEVMTEIRRHSICLDEQQINQIANIIQKNNLLPLGYEMKNWSRLLLPLYLEIVEKTKVLYPILLPYIEIASAYTYKIETVEPINYNLSQPEFTLEDDLSDYLQPDVEIAKETTQAREETEREETLRGAQEEVNNEEGADIYGPDGDPLDLNSNNYYYYYERGDGGYDPFWERK